MIFQPKSGTTVNYFIALFYISIPGGSNTGHNDESMSSLHVVIKRPLKGGPVLADYLNLYLFCFFDLILYVPVNNFSVISGRVLVYTVFSMTRAKKLTK